MRRLFSLVLLLWVVSTVGAQTATTTPTETNVNYYMVACEDRAVVDLNGFIQSGYDVYLQAFRDFGAAGAQLTALQRVPINGTFEVSSVLTFNTGEKVILGQFASVKLKIARESDTSNVMFETTIDDVQDGCSDPSFPLTQTTTSTAPTTEVNTTTINGVVYTDSGIYRPDGQKLYRKEVETTEDLVQIGSRPSDSRGGIPGRTVDSGLIFAECDLTPRADPGRLFDDDWLTVFWSWYAKTPELVQDHINNAQYTLSIADLPITKYTVTPIRQLDDGNYWVFYIADIGRNWRPGTYRINFGLTWANKISDGYLTFGPGTIRSRYDSTCTFNIEVNPSNYPIQHQNPSNPLQQHLPN